jgi:O-antigen/teichoic acid export membrane protein
MSSKAADIAKVSAKGGFHLLWGLVVSTVISAVGSIFIAILLGADNYGLYGIVLTLPNMLAIFRDMGVNVAMTRYTAQFRAGNRHDELRSVFISGLIFEIILGLVLTIVSFLLSGYLEEIWNRPNIAPLIQIASISILAGALTTSALSLFTGMERMELTSIVWVAQSVIKTVLIVVLVLLGLGTRGATIGYALSTIIGGLVGVILIGVLYKTLPKPSSLKLEIKAYIGTMLAYGVPISLATILSSFLAQFYLFLLPNVAGNIIIGNYHVAQNFVILITFFATPITTILFPAFSKLDAQKERETLQNAFQYSVKYASLLVVPVTAMVMCLSIPAVSTIFANEYDYAPLFLALLAIQYLYTALGSLSNGNLIYGQGQTTYLLYLTILTCSIGFPMGYLLINSFGVLGLIATSLTAGIPSMLLSLRFIKQRYGVSINWGSSARILISSALSAAVTYAIIGQLQLASWMQLAIGVVTFLVILIPTMLLTRTVSRQDIDNIRSMLSSLGPLSSIANKILSLLEKAMDALKLS